jgi:hypothetical protein
VHGGYVPVLFAPEAGVATRAGVFVMSANRCS